MIDKAVEIIGDRLNTHLLKMFPGPSDWVKITPLGDHTDGTVTATQDKLVLFVVNIEHEDMLRNIRQSPGSAVGYPQSSSIHLNVYLMVAADFRADTYRLGLKMISGVFRHFQDYPELDGKANPELAETGLERLSIEVCNLGFEQMSQIWGMSGSRYVPSLLYKLRMVSIDADPTSHDTPNIARLPDETEP